VRGRALLTNARSFNGFSTNDVEASRAFYQGTLGLAVREDIGILTLLFNDGHRVLIYPKEDHQPATYTVLNFSVRDIDRSVADLMAAGIQFEHYPWTEDGIQRGYGPPIAWFKDPAGNILAVVEDDPEPPALGSIILSSDAPERLVAWYADLFEVEVSEGFLEFGPVSVQITSRDGIAPVAADPFRILLNLHVTDIGRYVARLDERNVAWVAPADQRPDGTFATFADPDGNHVQLIELSEDYWRRRAGVLAHRSHHA
jgi:predicted enzyme related to lactoylglutathione lyase